MTRPNREATGFGNHKPLMVLPAAPLLAARGLGGGRPGRPSATCLSATFTCWAAPIVTLTPVARNSRNALTAVMNDLAALSGAGRSSSGMRRASSSAFNPT